MLSYRAETVLQSIVSRYIERAVPVPSQSLISDPELGVSSATIRNEMARLEREGYITRPYTSAGSVPTDKGYRCYVESLTEVSLPLTEQRLVNHLFHQVEGRLGEWLNLAATLIAQLAQNVGVVTVPKPADCQFKHLELVALHESLALVVLVLRGARLKQQLITFGQIISQPALTAIANKLNAAYSDQTSPQILAKNIELSLIEQQVTDCVIKIMQAEDEQEYAEPYLDGLHFMLNQPEFVHSHRMADLMELVEHRNLLKAILPHSLGVKKVKVVIGKENESEIIQDFSVVIGRYGLPDEVVGTIGVVGPTRMPYARAISVVSYLSLVLSRLIGELYGKGTVTRLDEDNVN